MMDYLAAIEDMNSEYLNWKKFGLIRFLLKKKSISEKDADNAHRNGCLGAWGEKNFDDVISKKEIDSLADAYNGALNKLEFLLSEKDAEKQYQMKRSLIRCLAYVPVAQLERELGINIDS